MNPPIKGMTVRPMGEDYMAGAFVGFVQFAANNEDAVRRFTEAHPKLKIPKPRNTIEAAIDEACGVNKQIGAAFCDWVALELWGEEAKA